jgi:hypothetical protein
VLAPSIPYGVSTLAIGWPGTVSLSVPTFRRLIVEVVAGLASHGFRRFVLANYQADPDHLRAMGAARRELTRRLRVQILVAGFEPGARPPTPMVNPRVRALMRSPNPRPSGTPASSRRPSCSRWTGSSCGKDSWFDFRRALARGARNFRGLGPGGAGYFGWPAVARAKTGRDAMALRSSLMARRLLHSLGKRSRSETGPVLDHVGAAR